MQFVEVKMKIPKETYELAIGVSGFTKALKVALADGFQPGQDIPAILTASISNLIPALEGSMKIKDELKQHPKEFYSGVAFLGVDILDLFD